jgi:hypothetical protein
MRQPKLTLENTFLFLLTLKLIEPMEEFEQSLWVAVVFVAVSDSSPMLFFLSRIICSCSPTVIGSIQA